MGDIFKNFHWIYLLISSQWLPLIVTQNEHFRIAAVFEPEYEGIKIAFQNALAKVNMYEKAGPNRDIICEAETISPSDSFDAHKKVCREMKMGIAAIFGPISEIPRAHVQALSDAFEIPHIQAVWDAREPRENFSISVYPDHHMLSKAFADLTEYWGWKTFTVIYEDSNGLIRLQEVLKIARGDAYTLTIRRLEVYQNSYINLLKEMKEKNEYKIIIDCNVTKIKIILEEADKVNMLSDYYHYHFTNLDMSVLNLDQFKNKGANITSMRLIDPKRPAVAKIMAEWEIMDLRHVRSPVLGKRFIETEVALMYDAVHFYAHALAALAKAQKVVTEPLLCAKKETWKFGISLLNKMKALEYDGLSGKIRFENGKRAEFQLGIINLSNRGLEEIGSWQTKKGVNITVTYATTQHDVLARLKNTTLRVVTKYEPPYVMERQVPDEKGRMYEGFIIDLLDELQNILGFNYTIYEAVDKDYGSENKQTGKWNGMIGDLMERDSNKKADIAAAGFTITYDRAKVVDFTMPFLSVGITILYKKPIKAQPALFSFLSPLSVDVWIYMLAAYLCVSFMLFLIARFTPYEWENPHPCNNESETVENQFTILNCLWFTIGSLMQQGCDIAPKAISTRMVACLWWFFVLIFISSYTANLTAFLTVSRMDSPIKNADDLSKQTKIKYGTFKNGSTRSFFLVRLAVHAGSDIAPKTTSTRFVASVWYLFTMIIVSTYTANLTAFLTIHRLDSPIHNVEDLAQQTHIQYGTLKAGATRNFFKNSNISTYQRMNAYMTANEDSVMVSSTIAGFERVKASENYAYLAESSSVDYQIQRNCDLMQIGDLLDSKGFGIAGPKDSPFIPPISRHIVYLQEQQIISKIYTRWWVEKSETNCPKEDDSEANTNALGVENVGGVFVVLTGGSIFAVLVSFLEFIWKVRKNAKKDKQTFISEMAEELKLVLRCKSTRNIGTPQNIDKG